MARRGTFRMVLLLIVGVLLGTLVGCGTDSEVSTKDCKVIAPASKGKTEVTVKAVSMQFDQRCIQVQPGTLTVTFSNEDKGIAHNFHVQGHGIDESTELKAGRFTEELVLELTKPGTYDFKCDPHANMTGKIVVKA